MGSPAENGRSDNVHSLRGVRVLVAARDARFVRATTFLLGRHGFVVDSTTNPGDFLDVAERTAPNVVVLDASASLGRAARTALAIQGLLPRTQVLLVYEEVPRSSAYPAFGKWTSLEPLIDHIERLHGRARRARHSAT